LIGRGGNHQQEQYQRSRDNTQLAPQQTD
jgi:hypothetical protein